MVRTKNLILILLIVVILFLVAFTHQQYDYKSITTNSVEDLSNSTNEENETSGPETLFSEESNDTIYYVYWPICKEIYSTDDSFFAYKNETFALTINISKDNLKSVMFKLSWEDDLNLKTPLFCFGRDILTFSIKYPDGLRLYKKKSIGGGTICFTKDDINRKPTIAILEANNESDVWGNLTKHYNTTWKNETIQIKVDIKIGEISKIRRRIEMGNEFKLQISYEYYKPELSIIEDKPPKTEILSGPTELVDYNKVTFSWLAYDDITPAEQLDYSYKLLGYNDDWLPWTLETSTTYDDLPDGCYTFYVKSRDHRDNIDLTPAQQSFSIDVYEGDIVHPDTIILTGSSGPIDYNTVTFTWTGSDDVTSIKDLKYSYKLEGKDSGWLSWTTSTSKTYINLENKPYVFKVRAKDEADNIDKTPAVQSFTVDVNTLPNRFATSVIDYNFGENHHPSYADPFKTLGAPYGLGDTSGSLDVLSLGKNGDITLGFDVTITNGIGEDFIVFENPFYITSQPDKVFAELMYIEVSTNGINFSRFPSISATLEPGLIYPNDVTNLAGVWPVYANVDKNEINPFNPNEAGGDAFDLADLTNDPLVQSGDVNLQDINYIRLIDIVGDGSCFDSQGNPIYDPTDMDNGADVDAISIINYI